MRKILIIIFFLILIPIICNAKFFRGSSNTTGLFSSAGCNYAGCSAGCKLFDWDCSTINMASNVCSLGDTSASLTGEANVTSGYIDITDDTNNGADYYSFSTTTWDMFPPGAATIKMTIDLSVISHNGKLMSFYDDGDNSMSIVLLTSSGNDIQVNHEGNAVIESNNFDTNLSLSTEYNIVIAYDTVTGMDVSINGGSSWIGVPASSTITTMTSDGSATLGIGNSTAVNVEGSIDDVKIYSGYKVDI